MKTLFLLFFMLTTLASANEAPVTSELVFDNESFTRDHELNYGVSNNYALIIAEHKITTYGCLLFHYGTRLGVVTEDHTATNGFGIAAQEYALVLEADIGIDYLIEDKQTLTLKSTHRQNELQQQLDSQFIFGYAYRF